MTIAVSAGGDDGGAIVVARGRGLAGHRSIPIALVQTVPLKRVVLTVRRADLPVR